MKYTEQNVKTNVVVDVAKKMLVAALTAPKGRGQNNLEFLILDSEDLNSLANEMEKVGNETNQAFFIRDASCIRKSDAVLLLGAKIKNLGLSNCGYCGFDNCSEKNMHTGNPCAFNTIDLGIAIGSAVSIAADNRIDNRVMFSAGVVARDMKYFENDVKIVYAIALSASQKSIFFDR